MLTVILQEGLLPETLLRGVRLAIHLARVRPLKLVPLTGSTIDLLKGQLSHDERTALDNLVPEEPGREAVTTLREHLSQRAAIFGPPEVLYLWSNVPLPPASEVNSRVVLLEAAPGAQDVAPWDAGHRAIDVFPTTMGFNAMVAEILKAPRAAPYAVRQHDLPAGTIAHHAALPSEAPQTTAQRTVVLCAGAEAAASEALAKYLADADHIIVAYPDRCARLVMDMPLMCNGKMYTTSFKVRRDLYEHLRLAAGQIHFDVVHLEETPDAVARMDVLLQGLARLMHTHNLRRNAAPPRLVVCAARPSLGHGPTGARIGAQVASHAFKTGILHAGAGMDVNWFGSDAPWYTENARVYLGLDESPSGTSRDELGPVSLGRLLRNGEVNAMLHPGPFVARSIAARAQVNRHSLAVIGMLHSIHGAGLQPELTAQLLEGSRQPYDAIVSPSRCGALSFARLQDAVAQWLSRRTGKPYAFTDAIEVIPYGIDTTAFANLDRAACRRALSLPDMGPVLLHMGRIDKQEKADLLPLLIATQQLLDRHPFLTVVICGGTTPGDFYADTLQSNANELGIGQAVRIVRDVSWTQKRLYHGAADIAVALGDSIQETYGLSLVEAMAAGLPVVAAAWDGFREIVRHEQTGLLVPTLWTDTWEPDVWLQRAAEGPAGYGHRDLHESVAIEVPALVNALDTLLTQNELRARMGECGREIARAEYDERVQVQRLLALCIDRMEQAAGTPWVPDAGAAFTDPVAQRFVHYASALLKGDGRVVSAPQRGPSALDAVLSMAGIADRGSRQVLHQMMELCQTPQSVAALEQSLAARTHVPMARLRPHILRALKYNLLVRLG